MGGCKAAAREGHGRITGNDNAICADTTRQLDSLINPQAPAIPEEEATMAFSQKLYDAIVDGKAAAAQAAVRAELAEGADPMALIAKTMIPAMDQVGKLFQEEEYFVPELMLAGRAMKAAMEPLRPLLAAAGAKPAGVIVAGTVQGDLHDIGKNLVVSMLEGAGFEVHDLGADVSPDAFIAAIRQHRPQILCLSALLTVTMPAMKTTLDAIDAAGLRSQLKVLVGGAPVTTRYAREIGADGYGASATDAVTLARDLISKAA
jgi:corrinoid protein of di/trimethylamine methyltransferase